MRSEPPEPPPANAAKLLPWVALAVAILAGVALAFRYGSRVTPLIDGIR